MSSLTKFKAVYCGGIFIPNLSAVTALFLLFEKVFLPNNFEFVTEFAKKYRLTKLPFNFKPKISSNGDPFSGLTSEERENASIYLEYGVLMAILYEPLFPTVFETQLFPDGRPGKHYRDNTTGELIRDSSTGKLIWERPHIMELISGDDKTFSSLIFEGYIPIVCGSSDFNAISRRVDNFSAKEIAALLSMQAIMLLFPRTKEANAELILEARH